MVTWLKRWLPLALLGLASLSLSFFGFRAALASNTKQKACEAHPDGWWDSAHQLCFKVRVEGLYAP